jgi:hypothetical protein
LIFPEHRELALDDVLFDRQLRVGTAAVAGSLINEELTRLGTPGELDADW